MIQVVQPLQQQNTHHPISFIMDSLCQVSQSRKDLEKQARYDLSLYNQYKQRDIKINSSRSTVTSNLNSTKKKIKLTLPSKFQTPLLTSRQKSYSNQMTMQKIKQKIQNSAEKRQIPLSSKISTPLNYPVSKYQPIRVYNQKQVQYYKPPINTPHYKGWHQKFNWKSIPQNSIPKLQQKNDQIIKSGTLQLPKNFQQTYATYAETNGILSIQQSKNIQSQYVYPSKQPQWLEKVQYKDSFIHQKTENYSSNSVHQSLLRTSNARNLLDFHNIDQIQSLTQSRASQPNPDLSRSVVVDQSFVQWTYQTGFKTKTQPNQIYEQF